MRFLLEEYRRDAESVKQSGSVIDELGKLLAGTGSYRVLIALFAFSGLRLGEALGLIWDDLDLEGGFIRVRAQLSRKRERVVEKTAGSRREVVLVPQLAKILREHRMASRFKSSTELRLPGARRRRPLAQRGRPRRRARGRERRPRGRDAAHLPARLRLVLIVGLGLDPVNVARQLGHSDPTITLSTYSHLFERARHADEMRQKLGDGFGHLLSAGRVDISVDIAALSGRRHGARTRKAPQTRGFLFVD